MPPPSILKLKGDKAVQVVLAFMQRNGLPSGTQAVQDGVAKTIVDLYQTGGILAVYAGSPLANELNSQHAPQPVPQTQASLGQVPQLPPVDAVAPQTAPAFPQAAPVNPQPAAPIQPQQAPAQAPVFNPGPVASRQPNQGAGLTAHEPHQVPVHAPGDTSDAPNSLTDKPVPTPTVRY